MELILIVVVLAVLGAVAVGASRRNKERELARREDELAPVRKLAFEDITAFGEDLQQLDLEMSGHELDAGATADYQRALDAYESAKTAGDSINGPEDIRHVTGDRRGRSLRHRMRTLPRRRRSRCRPGARRASSILVTAPRSPTCPTSRRTASSGTCLPAPSTSSASAPAPSRTCAR